MLLNVQKIVEEMERSGLDGLVATTAENVLYASDFWSIPLWTRRSSQNFAVIGRRDPGNPVIVLPSAILDQVASQYAILPRIRRFGAGLAKLPETAPDVGTVEARLWSLLQTPQDPDIIAALAAALDDLELKGGVVGIDEMGIHSDNWNRLVGAAPQTRFVAASSAFLRSRSIKTPAEVERLRRSARIAEDSILASLKRAADGVTDVELATTFYQTTIALGGVPVVGSIGIGADSAMAFSQPSGRRLRKGDIIRFDVGGRYEHYRADISRCAVFGEPAPKIRTYHRALRAGVERAYDMIRPGVRVADVFSAVIETVRRNGIPHYERSAVGHGIGIDGFDYPELSGSSPAVFEEQMVICIETPYYELGWGGLQVEDMAVVTRTGIESLMTTDRDLIVV